MGLGNPPWATRIAFFAGVDDGNIIWEVNPLAMLKHASAFVPIMMSLGALATVLIYLALHGPAPQADEGAAAHIWQLLMAAQMPIVFFFAIRWLPSSPRYALVLALQGGTAIAAVAPVFVLQW